MPGRISDEDDGRVEAIGLLFIGRIAVVGRLIGLPIRDLAGSNTFFKGADEGKIGVELFGIEVRVRSAPRRVVDLDALTRIGLARLVFNGGGNFQ